MQVRSFCLNTLSLNAGTTAMVTQKFLSPRSSQTHSPVSYAPAFHHPPVLCATVLQGTYFCSSDFKLFYFGAIIRRTREICQGFFEFFVSFDWLFQRFRTSICRFSSMSNAFSCITESLLATHCASTMICASGCAAFANTAFEITQILLTTPTNSITS